MFKSKEKKIFNFLSWRKRKFLFLPSVKITNFSQSNFVHTYYIVINFYLYVFYVILVLLSHVFDGIQRPSEDSCLNQRCINDNIF